MSTTTLDDQVNPSLIELKLGSIATVFNSVVGYSVSCNVAREPNGFTASGDIAYMFRSPPAQYGDLMCEAALSTTDNSLFEWWEQISAGTLTPQDGTLMLFDPLGKPQATFNIVGALLTSLEVTAVSAANPDAAGVTAVFNCLSYTRVS